MAKNVLIGLLVVIIIVLGAFQTMRPAPESSQITTEDTVANLQSFVNRAATLIQTKGEGAFADFRNTSGEWINGEEYVFVYDTAGKTLVLPLQREVEGTDRINVADSNGEKYVKTMVDILKTKDYGWNSYVYMKPGATDPAEKLSYFKKVTSGGKSYIVGSGIYLK